MQEEYSSQDICKKIARIAKIYSKISQIKDYSKISKLDYDKFINALEKAKEVYPKNEKYFEHLQKFAYACKGIYEKDESVKSQFNSEILNLACYKFLEKAIKNGKTFDGLSGLSFGINAGILMNFYDGINHALSVLKECATTPKKEQDLQM